MSWQAQFQDIWMDIWLDGCPLLSSVKCPLNIHAAFAGYQWFRIKNGHLTFEKRIPQKWDILACLSIVFHNKVPVSHSSD